ncbi:methyl-accepting chemotaxis protein [Brevibacillus sp. B_LB10_24]|uniref:methyl-accepting chemotaxis protein n=1 Tax=Brevibacillus sp. B_LB10_24 TaxID=3380645 RepID=UPI0038BCDB6F
MLQRTSIRYKMLLTLVFITLVPILTAGYFQYENAKQGIYNVTIEDLRYITKLKAKELAPYTQTKSPGPEELKEITKIVYEVGDAYYQPNGMTGYAYLMDGNGVAFIHPSDDTRGKDLSGYDFAKKMFADKQGWVEYDWEGETKLSAFEMLPNGWMLVIGSYQDDLFKPFEKSKTIILGITVVAGAVALLAGAVIVSRLIRPIKNLVGAMQKAERGDLTQQVPVTSGDELGQLSRMFNEMLTVFRKMMAEVQDVSEQVAGASEELTASAGESARASEQISIAAAEIAAGSERQKETVQTTTATLHRMGRDIEQIASFADRVNQDSAVATQYAHEGEQTLSRLAREMDEISTKVQTTEEAVRLLGEQSEAIIGIISIIQDISEKTNLLALNAAIEAARAGEQGKSFAVVATEVRKLAEQSRQSAEEISQLVYSINTEIQDAVSSMGETTRAVQVGREGAGAAGQAFQQILKAVEDVNRQIEQMNQAAQTIRQDTGRIVGDADEIARLATIAADDIQEVAAASQQQTASTEEMNAASESLAQMANKLSEQVKRFTI